MQTISVELWWAVLIISSIVILFGFSLTSVFLYNQKKNIASQKAKYEELREREQKYDNLFNNVTDIVYVHSLDGYILQINTAVTRILGYEIDEVINKPLMNLVSLEHAAEYQEYLDSVLNKTETNGLLFLMSNQREEFIFEYRNSITYERGLAMAVRGIARNMTEQIKAANALAISEKRNRLLFDLLPYGGEMIDENGIITDCSRGIKRLLGYQREEVIGRPMIEFIAPKYLAQVRERFDEIMKGRALQIEMQMLHKDGHLVDVIRAGQPIINENGDFAGLMTLSIDISAKKKAEHENKRLEAQIRQSQKMDAIGTLAGGIAHDFNNILAAIQSFTFLASDDLSEHHKAQQHLREIAEAGKRGKELVRQLLTFSRRVEREYKPINIAAAIKDSMKMIRSLLPTNMEIKLEIDKNSGVILSNDVEIQQLLMNLCTNAYQAMLERGKGIIEIRVNSVEVPEDVSIPEKINMDNGKYASISVRDTGKGIDQSIMDRIFEPFFTTHEAGEGTGMGLSVVHGIVKSHDGEIFVESEPGIGTNVTVLLPMISDEPVDAKVEKIQLQRGKGMIMLVDDESQLIKAGSQLLKRIGYSVKAFDSSLNALENFRKDPSKYDVIVSDMNMPGMTGIDLACEIHSYRPELPVILMIGTMDLNITEMMKKYHIFEFLEKPVDATVLSNILVKATRKENAD
ncbi:MAG: PAS domain S-box protein [Calditrichaceae bacterium]